MALQPGQILDNGRYRIARLLGRGGFGFVYLAEDSHLGTAVAIKELIPALVADELFVERFIQEARATLRLAHPNLVRARDVFQDGGNWYTVMDYLPGGSLADRLQRGPLAVDEAVRIAIDLCLALSYAHAQGVVHCDVKPANVLFDSQGKAHLADFGVAHVSDQLLTHRVHTGTGAVLGTVRYMSPEQLEGVRDDPPLDIYSLGALLYEMLTGQPHLPFETETTPAAQMRNMQRIQGQLPRPLGTVNPAVPDWLAQVVDQALRKMPAERFPTAEALRIALQHPGLRRASAPRQGPDRTKRRQTAKPPAPASLKLLLPDGREFALVKGTLTLGRDPARDVVLHDIQVSRHHATLHIAAGGVRVTDQGSTNGTFVNDKPLKPRTPCPLQPGDTLRLGKNLAMHLEVSADSLLPVAPPLPERQAPLPPPPPQRTGQKLATWQWGILAALSILLVALFVGLAIALSRSDGGAPAAMLPPPSPTPTTANTPEPTATFTPVAAAIPITPTAAVLDVEPPPGECLDPSDPVHQAIQDTIWRYAQIKAAAIGREHDDSQLSTVLAGTALKEQQQAVQWQRDNGAYYETTLHWIRYEWLQQTDATHAQALVTKKETLLYYPRDWTTPSTKKSCHECEYQVLYDLQFSGSQWYITEKEVQNQDTAE
jgi:serine/threonine protein kinase